MSLTMGKVHEITNLKNQITNKNQIQKINVQNLSGKNYQICYFEFWGLEIICNLLFVFIVI